MSRGCRKTCCMSTYSGTGLRANGQVEGTCTRPCCIQEHMPGNPCVIGSLCLIVRSAWIIFMGSVTGWTTEVHSLSGGTSFASSPWSLGVCAWFRDQMPAGRHRSSVIRVADAGHNVMVNERISIDHNYRQSEAQIRVPAFNQICLILFGRWIILLV